MPKHDYFSPKAIGNRQKAKGLQKLRWWCEVCQKQCRDENGFKCHQTSEAHIRQMKIFAEDPTKAMTGYSVDFERNFLTLLSRRFGTKRVAANVAYKEYISDKQHVHMNSTRWTTLTGFVQYLGKQGHCVVDETDKGWFIQWIDKDPKALARQAALDKKRQNDADDEEQAKKQLKRRVKAAHHDDPGGTDDAAPTALEQSSRTPFSLSAPAAPSTTTRRSSLGFFEQAASSEPQNATTTTTTKRMIDKLMVVDPKTTKTSSSGWLVADIVVKVMNRDLAGGAYYKKKGTVEKVIPPFTAVVKMLDTGDEVQLDQDDLETVIPNTGKAVTLLRGEYKGQLATVLDVDLQRFAVRLKILPDQPNAGTHLDAVPYDDLSKTAR